jgi:WhiB family redox-sensing transcriptional regulator
MTEQLVYEIDDVQEQLTEGASWQVLGTCTDVDPELFFPMGRTKRAQRQAEAAVAICRSCPVIEKCLNDALANPALQGVWGGTTEDQRLVILGLNRARRSV